MRGAVAASTPARRSMTGATTAAGAAATQPAKAGSAPLAFIAVRIVPAQSLGKFTPC